MKIKVDTGHFARTLGRVQGPLKGKKISPAAECVTLETMPGKLRIVTSDSEMMAVATMPAEVKEDGMTMINGKALYDVAKAFPVARPDPSGKDAPTTVSLKTLPNANKTAGNVEIESGKTRYRLPYRPTEAVAMPDIQGIEMKQIGQAILGTMLAKTSHAMSGDHTRYNLNGMLFEPGGGGLLRTVATDGHRVFYMERPAAFPAEFESILVSDRGIEELQRVLSMDKQTMMGWDTRRLIVSIDDLLLVLPLIDGKFPSYREVLPASTPINVKIRREDLVNAIHRLTLVDKSGHPSATFAFEKGMVVLTASSADLGEAREEIDTDYQGGAFRIGFNASYLRESLSVMDCEYVMMGVIDQLSPGTFEPALVEDQKPSMKAVIMPMRI